jgi:dimethylglycine dehydrogenase
VLYHLAKVRLDRCLPAGTLGPDGGIKLARGGRVSRAQRRSEHGRASGLHDRPAVRDQEESGQDIGLHMTGGLTMAGTPDRWEWLQSAYRVFQSIGIEDCRLVTPEEAGELPDHVDRGFLGGMWADREGYIDTTGTVHAYAKARQEARRVVIEHNQGAGA